MATIALVSSRFWLSLERTTDHQSLITNHQSLLTSQRWVLVVTGMVFVQLVLGASMRHSHAGLAIPDFPTSYGHLFPPLDDATVAQINQQRGAASQPYTSAALILLQYVHRVWAVLIVVGLVFTAIRLLRGQLPIFFRRCAAGWILLVVVQVCLGAWTVLSNKAADIATAHVLFGALTLMLAVLLAVGLSGLLHYSPNGLSHSGLPRSIGLGTV